MERSVYSRSSDPIPDLYPDWIIGRLCADRHSNIFVEPSLWSQRAGQDGIPFDDLEQSRDHRLVAEDPGLAVVFILEQTNRCHERLAMADFCKQCSEYIFGEDFGDMRGLVTEDQFLKQGVCANVLCEGCGVTQVNHLGECVHHDKHDNQITNKAAPGRKIEGSEDSSCPGA